MVIIRTFSEGILSEVSTWGIADGLNITGDNKADNRIQINLILTEDSRQKRQVSKSKEDASFHFVDGWIVSVAGFCGGGKYHSNPFCCGQRGFKKEGLALE